LLQRHERYDHPKCAIPNDAAKNSVVSDAQPEIRFASGHRTAYTCTTCCVNHGTVDFFVLHIFSNDFCVGSTENAAKLKRFIAAETALFD
jgi:hypothetical protein